MATRVSLGGSEIPMDSLFDSLLAWAKTFGVAADCLTPADLSDGVACAAVLNRIIPDIFDDDKLGRISSDAGDNARLKAGNIRKIKREMEEFYETQVQVSVDRMNFFDEAKVAAGELDEVVRLLELLLGCAVQCTDKQQHVTDIMGLEAGVKKNLMAVIQRLMENVAAIQGGAEMETHREETEGQLTDVQVQQIVAEKDEIAQLYQELKDKHDLILQQLEDTQSANEKLEQAVASAGAFGGVGTDNGADAGEMQQKLHSTQAAMDEYKHTLDHERHEHEAATREQNRALAELRRALEGAEQEAALAGRLQDEMEEMRENVAMMGTLEKKNALLTQRVEEYEEMQKEALAIQSTNSSQLQRIAMLEETERRGLSQQQTLAKEKAKVAELEAKCLEETKRGDTLLIESKHLKEENQDMQNENRRIAAEKRELSNRVKDLEEDGPDIQIGQSLGLSLKAADAGSAKADLEKIAKLEAENAILRASSAGGSDLQDTIDDLATRKSQLETQNREMNMQVIELTQKLARAQKNSVKSTDDRALEQLAVAERDLKKFQKKSAELEETLQKTQDELLGLQKAEKLMGLDQKALVSKIEADVRAEVAEQQAGLEVQLAELELELEKCQGELGKAKAALSSLETKHEKLAEKHEEKTEQYMSVLIEKSSLQDKMSTMTAETTARLQEQELKFQKSSTEMEERLKTSIGSGAGASKEDMLELQLKLTQLEKELMGSEAKAERERMQAVNDVQEESRKKDTQIEQMTALLRAAKEQHKKFVTDATAAVKEQKGAELDVTVTTLKNQLEEKGREFERLKLNKERLESQHKREQQLMVQAWYDLGLKYQRLTAEQGGALSGGSFLTKQRQASMSTPRK